jgi:hypothetical protein
LDHIGVAEAVRQVAYLINVPHVFTPEYPADETHSQPCKTPVILTVYDGYAGAGQFDLVVDVEAAFPKVCEMAYCHQSQIVEWLPWVGRHQMKPPRSLEEWQHLLRQRFERRNRELGLSPHPLAEVFTVTAWGTVPTLGQIVQDVPNILPQVSHLDRLQERLERWSGFGTA